MNLSRAFFSGETLQPAIYVQFTQTRRLFFFFFLSIGSGITNSLCERRTFISSFGPVASVQFETKGSNSAVSGKVVTMKMDNKFAMGDVAHAPHTPVR